MFKLFGPLLAFGLSAAPLLAQQPGPDSTAGDAPGGGATSRCAQPDTVMVSGNSRVDDATIRGTIGLVSHSTLNYRDAQRAVKALFATGNFDDVKLVCRFTPATQKVVLDVQVRERPVLAATSVTGVKQVPKKEVNERLELSVGSPIDPAVVARAMSRADSLYESKGYYLAQIRADSSIVNGALHLAFRIDEGNRMSISGIKVQGTKGVPASAVVGAMQTKPEGFFWWRKGEFDEAKFAGDLSERIPGLYGSRGYIDARVTRDTLLIDRTRGKGAVDLTVQEGPRYTVGSFEVVGNKHFSNDEIRQYYPFEGGVGGQSLAQGALGLLRRSYKNPNGTFDASRWDDATNKLRDAYNDQGYIYATIHPIEERVPSADSVRKVNLRWEVEEHSPAIVNRIDIIGNDYTYESCIRQQIVMAPGQVFNRAALIRSYQNIGNLNFFESPMSEPEVKPDSAGDVDLVFKVKEKRTGNINFGASMGEGTGLGGFIGLDQPNLFGRCKKGQLNWQFGRYVNDFTLTYEDPAVLQSWVSASVTAYHTLARYRIADLGQSTRTGGQFQFGFPVRNSYYSRFYVSYGGEAVKYSDNSGTLLGTLATTCDNCFRSTLGFTFQHDTRTGQPFPMAGAMQSLSAQFNGGLLGGTASFQKYTTEVRSYAPILQFGPGGIGAQPMTLLIGLTARSGVVVGDPGPFFSSQSFALGGTQYGEPLRGYCEFAITPSGFDPSACNGQARRASFGNAFFSGTAELGFRFNQSIYIDAFMDGGNVWDKPRQFDPTRLFRSVGIGGSTLSPLGPIGLDFAYGLDRVDALGRKNPGWKVHFKLGQIF